MSLSSSLDSSAQSCEEVDVEVHSVDGKISRQHITAVNLRIHSTSCLFFFFFFLLFSDCGTAFHRALSDLWENEKSRKSKKRRAEKEGAKLQGEPPPVLTLFRHRSDTVLSTRTKRTADWTAESGQRTRSEAQFEGAQDAPIAFRSLPALSEAPPPRPHRSRISATSTVRTSLPSHHITSIRHSCRCISSRRPNHTSSDSSFGLHI